MHCMLREYKKIKCMTTMAHRIGRIAQWVGTNSYKILTLTQEKITSHSHGCKKKTLNKMLAN